ncbi:cupin [Prauserella sp. PE36]|uniref:Cupin domain-containing protein n=1 Tax=Prauserella endophytica TaxID=1592324 RepID=A0ABY2RZ66_9PSEU|nr:MULTISPECIES: cupin domain-containing protein [Prauserella]PXY26823.1 cupin [Prauserella coralliicola]RBM15570.1 cupin [Prauserella sp. PE36]TKG66245.1 cupin domain-containing protein [Prauserella endophytica]
MTDIDADAVIAKLGLRPLPVEGGLFVQTWRSDNNPAPAGTATYAAFTRDPDSFSAMHRLAVDEIWHFYLGDPVDLLVLHPDGTHSTPRLGSDVLGGQHPQLTVPAGHWFGASLAPGGTFALFGNTLAPGFHSGLYEGGERDSLVESWPDAEERIRALTRPGADLVMPSGL